MKAPSAGDVRTRSRAVVEAYRRHRKLGRPRVEALAEARRKAHPSLKTARAWAHVERYLKSTAAPSAERLAGRLLSALFNLDPDALKR